MLISHNYMKRLAFFLYLVLCCMGQDQNNNTLNQTGIATNFSLTLNGTWIATNTNCTVCMPNMVTINSSVIPYFIAEMIVYYGEQCKEIKGAIFKQKIEFDIENVSQNVQDDINSKLYAHFKQIIDDIHPTYQAKDDILILDGGGCFSNFERKKR